MSNKNVTNEEHWRRTDYYGRAPYTVTRNWSRCRMVSRRVARSGHNQRGRGDSGIEMDRSWIRTVHCCPLADDREWERNYAKKEKAYNIIQIEAPKLSTWSWPFIQASYFWRWPPEIGNHVRIFVIRIVIRIATDIFRVPGKVSHGKGKEKSKSCWWEPLFIKFLVCYGRCLLGWRELCDC